MRMRDIVLVGISTANYYMENAVLSLLVARRVNKYLAIALVALKFSQDERKAIEKQGIHAIDFGQEETVREIWQQLNRTGATGSLSRESYAQFIEYFGGIEVYMHPFVPVLMANLGYEYTLYLDSDNFAITPFDLNALKLLESHAFVFAHACDAAMVRCAHVRPGFVNSGFVGYNNRLWLKHNGPSLWLATMAEHISFCISESFCNFVQLSDQRIFQRFIHELEKNTSSHFIGNSSTLSFTLIDWRFNGLTQYLFCPDFKSKSNSTGPPFFYHCTKCKPSPQCIGSFTQSNRRLSFNSKSNISVNFIADTLTQFPSPMTEWSRRIAARGEEDGTEISKVSCESLSRFESYKQFNLACIESCTIDPSFPLHLGSLPRC